VKENKKEEKKTRRIRVVLKDADYDDNNNNTHDV